MWKLETGRVPEDMVWNVYELYKTASCHLNGCIFRKVCLPNLGSYDTVGA